MDTIFEQVRNIAADIFQIPPEELAPASSPETVPVWDSVQHLNLVLALEAGFELQFEPEEIDQMKDLGKIAALLEEKAVRSR